MKPGPRYAADRLQAGAAVLRQAIVREVPGGAAREAALTRLAALLEELIRSLAGRPP